MNPAIRKILENYQADDLLDLLSNQMTGSELNSFLLEVFDRRSKAIRPEDLLSGFVKNRFLKPSVNDPIKTKELELDWLKQAAEENFHPVTLSPLAPFGSCSAFGTVHQNKIVTSVRGTEVVADATNMMAIQGALDLVNEKDKKKILRYSTTHRHVRAQQLDNPQHTPHFVVFCLTSAGYDNGSFSFELEELERHVSLLILLIRKSLPGVKMSIKFFNRSDDIRFMEQLKERKYSWSDLDIEYVSGKENNYYQTIQFKIYLSIDGNELDIADGGFVDWIQKLTGNKKMRCMISGAGIELILNLKRTLDKKDE